MRVLLIEDEPLAASRLQLMLAEYDAAVEVVSTLESIEDAVQFFNTNSHPDLVFLDIQLADGISFGIFSKVQVNCPVVFTTAYDQYAIEAFRLFSIDYLLKPVTKESLVRAMTKYRTVTGFSGISKQIADVIEKMHKPEKNYRTRFLVKSGTRMFFVEGDQIAYFSIEDKAMFLTTLEGNRYLVEFTMEKLQEMLDPRNFFRLNRSVICNSKSIKEIKTYFNNRLKIALKAGGQIDEAIVSRDRVTAFKEWAEG
jgi:two-component system, LytTR family, response regulator LytT